jgi:hypothetical protein
MSNEQEHSSRKEYKFSQKPHQRCEDCMMYEDPRWCRWYKWRIEDPKFEHRCNVDEIIIVEV